jgi:phosphatidylserine/phosphatidylglycerophosphate/cardiolipin synthase-like enzyme
MMQILRFTLLGFALVTAPAFSAPFSRDATYSVCFTPGGNCTGLIVDELAKAKETVLLQAYSFTSKPIAEALVAAKERGVLVKAILDKSQRTERYSGATFLSNSGIDVKIDERPAIAHNKVIIIDGRAVVTGSFNFTRAAQEKNAENVFIIHDAGVAANYVSNWERRAELSVKY